MALDSLRSIDVIPASSKAAQSSASASSGAASFGSALASSGGLGYRDGASGTAASGEGFNPGTGASSGRGSHSSSGTGSGPNAGSRTNTTVGSHDATGAQGSNKASASDPSSDSSNSNAKDSRKDSGSPTASSNAKPGSNARSKQSTSQSQTDATNAAAIAASTAAGSGVSAKGGANAQGNTQPATFLESFAQSQTNAAQNTAAAASAAAPADATDADATAAANGKAKTANNKASDATSPSSLAFISQSLAATIAGVQQPTPAQPIATTSSTAVDSDTHGDATEAISLDSNSSAAVQKLATTLAHDTASALKAAADANSGTSGPKSDSSASTGLTADGSSAAVSAFQAQMSISSHFQQPPTPDSSPNRINAQVGSPAFNDELGGKVTWLATQGMQSASVQLSPEHLGPLSVHISVQAGSASVSFNAAHAYTRAALEQALPRLREMFATNGLTLSDANVSHQSPRDQAQRQSISPIGAIRGGASEETTSSIATSVVVSRRGLVDTYV